MQSLKTSVQLRYSVVSSVFYPEYGGQPNAVYQRCIALAKMGCKVQLFIPEYSEIADLLRLKNLEKLGVSIVSLPTTKSKWVPTGKVPSRKAYPIIKKYIFQFKPDVLMVDEPIALKVMSKINIEVGTFQDYGIYTCAIVHSNGPGILSFLKKRIFAYIVKRQSRKLYNQYNSTVFSSEYLKDTMPYINNGMVITHLGIDKNLFGPNAPNNNSEKIVLYFGRISPEKNIDFLFEAAQNSIKQNQQVRWVFVGDGPDLARFSKSKFDRIEFMGAKHGADLRKFIQKADVFVSACEIEAFGLTIVEAMACGLPVLVPDKGAASNHFEDKVSGITYKTGNIDDFLEKLNILVNDDALRRSIGNNAAQLPLSWEEATANLVQSNITNVIDTKFDGILHYKLKDNLTEGPLELKIESIMNEHREALSEIKEYQKNGAYNLYIFLILSGVALTIGGNGQTWIYLLMQGIVFVFFFIATSIDRDMIINSAYVTDIEDKVNILLGHKLLAWQNTIGIVNHKDGLNDKSNSYQIGGVLIGLIYFIFYLTFCGLYSSTIESQLNQIIFISCSTFIYLGVFVILLISRKNALSGALARIYKNKTMFMWKIKTNANKTYKQ
jgi:glycosyltransferase involved in cell wall biosynthesis